MKSRLTLSAFLLLALALVSCKGGLRGGADASGAASGALIETGELAAVTSKTFVMQRLGQRWNDAKISWMAEHGQSIHAGDTIIQLDPINLTRYITDRETQLETQQAALEKMIVNQSNARSQNENSMFGGTILDCRILCVDYYYSCNSGLYSAAAIGFGNGQDVG